MIETKTRKLPTAEVKAQVALQALRCEVDGRRPGSVAR